MRVALVHDWLTGMRGGEKVLEVLCELYPDAHLYTLVHVPGTVSPTIERRPITPSFLQRLPAIDTQYRRYLPLMPLAVESIRLTGYDLVISSSHCVAKGVRIEDGALHICYCHTPMRYIWDLYQDYFGAGRSSVVVRTAMSLCAPHLRHWDVRTSDRVHHFIANSHHVRQRIQRHYGRDAAVIYPPVDTEHFSGSGVPGDYFLVAGAFAPYKRLDVAIHAFNVLGLPLKIVGTGQEEAALKQLARPNIEFLGWQSDAQLRDCYARCRALIFPAEEDFGIMPLEAMACGRPVIAYGRGGALETIVDGVTGLFFAEQTPDALREAMGRFVTMESRFEPARIRRHAELFNRDRFAAELQAFIGAKLEEWNAGRERLLAEHR